jgi:glycyl-tRNA synthetase
MSGMKNLENMQDLVSLCKRRGLIFPSSEVYGGIGSCWDYGPVGVEMKNNLKQLWWRAMVDRDDVEGLDASILMHPKVWEASGHVAGFTDPLVDCKKCKSRFRADKLETTPCGQKPSKMASECKADLTEARNFNLMFKTFMGPVEESASVVFLRPETAQGIFVNFLNVASTARQKVPFGIAQIGKAFRNEITPGNFTFRTREFEQMEMQYFVRPGTDEAAFEEWKATRLAWQTSLGIRPSKLRFHAHGPGELAHYAKAAFDIEYEFPIGWQEIEGIHNRSAFDLTQHQEHSGKKMEYFDEETKERYIPFVVETSAGCDRTLLAVLCDGYRAEEDRTVLAIHPALAAFKVAVFPLMKKAELMERAEKIFKDLRKHYRCDFDESGSIGKRYYRQDEIGTPFGVTVDFDTLEKNAGVTVRHRDLKTQERVAEDQLVQYIEDRIAQWQPLP